MSESNKQCPSCGMGFYDEKEFSEFKNNNQARIAALELALKQAQEWAHDIYSDERVNSWVHQQDYSLYNLLADCPVDFEQALSGSKLCETTLTLRDGMEECQDCLTSCNMGPCRDYLDGCNGRCVYCDHELKCHLFWPNSTKSKSKLCDLFQALLEEHKNEIETDRAGWTNHAQILWDKSEALRKEAGL